VDTTESPDFRELAADFAARASGPHADIDLGDCAIRIGRILQPAPNVTASLARLDILASNAETHLLTAPEPDKIDWLAAYLFRDLGYRGDADDYYDPQNSCLHRVLERQRGLPITLSILLIEVGRRLDLPIEGVGAPQHFLVRVPNAHPKSPHSDEAWRFLDPFHGGREIDPAQLRRSVQQKLTGRAGAHSASDSLLTAVTKRQILARVLQNLKVAGARRKDYRIALGAAEHLVAMTPWAVDEIRDRGLIAARAGRPDIALSDLRTYRSQEPRAPDAEQVAEIITQLQRGDAGESSG